MTIGIEMRHKIIKVWKSLIRYITVPKIPVIVEIQWKCSTITTKELEQLRPGQWTGTCNAYS